MTPGLQPSPSRLPLERQVPAEPLAAPGQNPAAGMEEMWYLPTWSETARLLGWRWILCLPAVAVLAGLLLLPLHPELWQTAFGFWKLIVIAVALPITLFIKQAKEVVRSRPSPFCIHCGYALAGLPDGHVCPECGRPYRFIDCEEYRRDPHWYIERYRRRNLVPPPQAPFDAGPVRRRKKSRDGT